MRNINPQWPVLLFYENETESRNKTINYELEPAKIGKQCCLFIRFRSYASTVCAHGERKLVFLLLQSSVIYVIHVACRIHVILPRMYESN